MKKVLLLSVVLFSGCGPPKFYGHTQDEVMASLAKMTKDMSPAEKKKFMDDCDVIVSPRGGISVSERSWLLIELNGMTADQVRKRAAEIRAQRRHAR